MFSPHRHRPQHVQITLVTPPLRHFFFLHLFIFSLVFEMLILVQLYCSNFMTIFDLNCFFSYCCVLSEGPHTLYRNLVSQGELQHDIYQENVASELDNLLKRLEQYEMEMEHYHISCRSLRLFHC